MCSSPTRFPPRHGTIPGAAGVSVSDRWFLPCREAERASSEDRLSVSPHHALVSAQLPRGPEPDAPARPCAGWFICRRHCCAARMHLWAATTRWPISARARSSPSSAWRWARYALWSGRLFRPGASPPTRACSRPCRLIPIAYGSEISLDGIQRVHGFRRLADGGLGVVSFGVDRAGKPCARQTPG